MNDIEKCCLCGKENEVGLYTRRGVICVECLDYYHEHQVWPKRPEPLVFGRNDKPAVPYAFTPEGRPIDMAFYLQHCKIDNIMERCDYCLTVDEVAKRDPFTGKPICAECAKNDPTVKLRPKYRPQKNSKPKKNGCASITRKLVDEALAAGGFTIKEITQYADCSVSYVRSVIWNRKCQNLPCNFVKITPQERMARTNKKRHDANNEEIAKAKPIIRQLLQKGGMTVEQIRQSAGNCKMSLVYNEIHRMKKEGLNPSYLRADRSEGGKIFGYGNLSKTSQKILAFIEQNPGATQDVIAKTFNIKKHSTENIIADLRCLQKIKTKKIADDRRAHYYIIASSTNNQKKESSRFQLPQKTNAIIPVSMTETQKIEYIIKHHKDKTNRQLSADLQEPIRNINSWIHQCIKHNLLTPKPRGKQNRKIDWNFLTQKYKK